MSYTIPTMTVPELLAALRAAPAQDVMIIMNDHQQEIIAALSGLEGVKGALIEIVRASDMRSGSGDSFVFDQARSALSQLEAAGL